MRVSFHFCISCYFCLFFSSSSAFLISSYPLLFLFEHMQIEFTKGVARRPSKLGIKLHRPQSNVREQHSRISTNKRLLYTPPTCPSNVRKIFLKKTKEMKKKRNRQLWRERKRKKERKKKEFSIRSILTRATMYIQSACSFPQFPAGFQKAHHTHTHTHRQALEKNPEN